MDNEILKQILNGITDLKVEIRDVKQGQARFEDSVNEKFRLLEAKVNNLETIAKNHEQQLKALLVLSTEDFKRLEKVEKKIDSLTSVTKSHEQKFQYLKAM